MPDFCAWVLTAAVCALVSLVPALNRPFHSDEAVQAWRVFQWIVGNGELVYIPEFHGLVLYVFAAPFLFFCENEMSLRLLPLLICAGTAAALPKIVRDAREPFFEFLVSLTLATVPLWLFYSGDFIQEPLFVSFAWLAGTLLFFREKMLTAGVFAGLAIACKESWIFFAAAFFAGTLAAGMRLSRRKWVIAGLPAVIIPAAFYSSFFTRVPDSLFYFPASVETGVDYFAAAGTLLPMIVFALAGTFLKGRSRELVFLTLSSAVLWILCFAFPLKEPWLLLCVAPGTVLAFAESVKKSRLKIPIFFCAIAANLGICFFSPLEKNCGYQETSRGIAAFVESAKSAPSPIAVCGNNLWPLPWFLRERADAAFFPDGQVPTTDFFSSVIAPLEFFEKNPEFSDFRTQAVAELRENLILELRAVDK